MFEFPDPDADVMAWIRRQPSIATAADRIHAALWTLRGKLGRPAAEVVGGAPIFCVSLPGSARRGRITAHAKKHKLKITFTPGIRMAPQGTERKRGLPYVVRREGFIIRHELYDPVDFGSLGCTAAHIIAILRFYTTTAAPYALIIEDDVDFDLLPYWPVTLAEHVAGAPKGWEVLHLQTHSRTSRSTGRYAPQSGCPGTFLYCVSRAGARKLWRTVGSPGPTIHIPFRQPKPSARGRIPLRSRFPVTGPQAIIADCFLYQTLVTYRNFDFPAITFCDGTSEIGYGLAETQNIAVCRAAALRLIDLAVARLRKGAVEAEVRLPGVPGLGRRVRVHPSVLKKPWPYAPLAIRPAK